MQRCPGLSYACRAPLNGWVVDVGWKREDNGRREGTLCTKLEAAGGVDVDETRRVRCNARAVLRVERELCCTDSKAPSSVLRCSAGLRSLLLRRDRDVACNQIANGFMSHSSSEDWCSRGFIESLTILRRAQAVYLRENHARSKPRNISRFPPAIALQTRRCMAHAGHPH